MTREEALKIVRNIYQTDKEKEALGVLIPELCESEDERIKKIITDSVFYQYGAGAEYKDVLDYLDKLEKQKEQKNVDIAPNQFDGITYGMQGYSTEKQVEWSEEDEKIAKEIEEELWYPGDFPDYPSKEESELYDDCQRRLDWFKNKLKSLRTQPKAEWSKATINGEPIPTENQSINIALSKEVSFWQ